MKPEKWLTRIGKMRVDLTNVARTVLRRDLWLTVSSLISGSALTAWSYSGNYWALTAGFFGLGTLIFASVYAPERR